MLAESATVEYKPYTLTPSISQRIIQHVEEGQYAGVAAQLEGVPLRTWEHWMDWARQEQEALALDAEAEPGSLAALSVSIQMARARCISKRVKRINTAALKPHLWPADMTMLERTAPEMYGKRTEVSVKSESVVVHVTAQLSEATQAKVWEIAARAQKALPPPAE